MQVGTSPAQSDAVSDWFSEALGVRCWLVRQQDGSRRAVERSQLLQRGPHALAPQVEAAAQEMKRADGGGSIGKHKCVRPADNCHEDMLCCD